MIGAAGDYGIVWEAPSGDEIIGTWSEFNLLETNGPSRNGFGIRLVLSTSIFIFLAACQSQCEKFLCLCLTGSVADFSFYGGDCSELSSVGVLMNVMGLDRRGLVV